MAGTGRVIASIYGYGHYEFPGATGRLNNFPGALTHFYPIPSPKTINGVTMQTVIELLPSGLTVPNNINDKFYAAKDVASIQSDSA